MFLTVLHKQVCHDSVCLCVLGVIELTCDSRLSFSPQGKSLDHQYEEHYLRSRDFDGRLFLDGDETVLAPKVDM